MNTTDLGKGFEEYVRQWFERVKPTYRHVPRKNGGILRRGKKTRQADLEFRRMTSWMGMTLGYTMPVLVECKYVGEGRSLDVKATAYQVNTAAAHFRSAETIIVTNSRIANKDALEKRHDVKIYDRDSLLMGNQMTEPRYLGKSLDEQVMMLEQDIRRTAYERAA